MSVLSDLRRLGGCAGGITIYRNAELAVEVRNLFKRHIELWPDTKRIMRRFFPHLDLGRVRFKNKCSLPGNWFTSANKVGAMTFGYDIYHKGKDLQQSWSKLELLMHELVHVEQVRRLGNSETRFACEYGKGHLAEGSYENNPMEVEAYDFVTAHPLPASLPANMRVLPKKP